ncbi:ATP-binding protein [Streptomyces sp. NPDC049585]|uniref:wHTH domain-containing protein n=1 Tax=Streptomyces sp. NPDC049585 TaxID=3155154 RepID=UPI003437DF23
MQGHNTRSTVANSQAAVIAQGHTVNVYGPLPDGPPAPRDPWVELAAESNVWRHVPPDRGAEPLRQLVVDVVTALTGLRDGTDVPDDPWVRDEGVVYRFAECVEYLLAGDGELDFHPAEAALLILTPFLYRTHYLQLTAAMRDAAGPSFTAFAESHDFLMGRARQSSDEDARPLTSWLFHRWLVQGEEFAGPQQVRRLLDDIGDPADAMGEILDVRRVCRLLHGLRRGADVCNREFLDTLPADDAVRVRRGGPQRIRDQRLVLLLALAYGMSRDVTALPQIVVEHVGIPDPVDLDQLHRTLSRSGWGGSRDLPVLRAECRHAAVIEGLREYVTRTDELLAAVRRTAHERVTHPFPTLPARLSSDEVSPADDVVKGWAGFRLDERRVRDLLLGVQLYKDRDLAIRELYQNALDACRYRRARTEYLDRTRTATYAYEGRITFDQATDEDGREYVECHDNGIGMGESELRGVFCKAGSRFVDQLDFKLERADWGRVEPPVAFYPNSRFGIGVLSYFMLADEMRVRTCRMDAKGELGPVLEVRVFGPGHLFRIVEVKARGEEADAGTRVRLYLREGERGPGWSCVDVLERLLGIAEFPTEVRHGGRTTDWERGVFRPREGPKGEALGINAHGSVVAWADPPAGAQVIWCEEGGALLVDGLVVQPTVRRGVLATRDSRPRGFVVNLFGPLAPNRLSADRANVLDDVSATLQEILGSAVHDLVRVDAPLPSYEWIVQVASANGALGDLITVAAVSAGRTFHLDGLTFSMEHQGCFPADLSIVAETLMDRDPRFWVSGYPPDDIVLWRLLAHRAEAVLEELTAVCPELAEVGEVRLALPSDMEMLAAETDGHFLWSWRPRDILGTDMVRISEATGASPEEVLERVLDFRSHERTPEMVAAVASGGGPALMVLFDRAGNRVGPGYEVTVARLMDVARRFRVSAEEVVEAWRCMGAHVPDDILTLHNEAVDHPLFSRETVERMGYLPDTGPIAPGQIAAASLALGLGVPEVCDRFRRYGFRIDPGCLPDRPDEDLLRFLSEGLEVGPPWLDRSEEVPPGHVIAVAGDLGMELPVVCERLAGLGFKIPSRFPADVRRDDLELLYDIVNSDDPFLRPGRPIRYAHLFQAGPTGVRAAIERLEVYGFDIPLSIPRRLTILDRVLLFNEDFWDDLNTEDTMPFARVLLMSRVVATAPEELVRLLDHYGVELSCRRMPDGLSREAAIELIGGSDLVDMNGVSLPAPLVRLIENSRRIGATIEQTWHWYRALGLPVIDLPRVLREAIPRIPRAS